MSHSCSWRSLVLLLLVACSTPEKSSLPAQPTDIAPPVTALPVDPAKVLTWERIQALIQEQKFKEALQATEDRLELAKAQRNEQEWTRALLQATQLQRRLHQYETALRSFMEQPWPSTPLYRAILHLFYARALTEYVGANSLQVRQRERVESQRKVDLNAWTLAQFQQEVQRAYQEVWALREVLDSEPVAFLEDYEDYLQPNDYLRSVHGTLRDAATYLYALHLASGSFWSTEREKEAFHLDLAALLRAEPTWAQEINLTQPSVHPLMKVAAVLGDLEAWHASRGEKEAALEARLQRLRQLHRAYSDEERRALIRRDLEEQLPRYESVPWWSMGMATLAEFQREAGMLARARETASRCQQKDPQSPGGKRCLSLQKLIEAPVFYLRAMSHDRPGQRSFAVEHRNLQALWFRAYPVDLEQRVASESSYQLLPSGHEQLKLLKEKPAAEWTVELPATPDHELHRTYVTPPLKGKGLYVVFASARQDFSQGDDNRVAGLNFILSDLALVRSSQEGTQELTVLNARTGEKVPSVEVRLYQRPGKPLETRRTDAQGQVRFEASDERRGHGFSFLARRGQDLALEERGANFYPQGKYPSGRGALVYTDRSVYRPLQKLSWKVVAFEGGGEQVRYRVLPRASLTVSLVDANGQAVERKAVQTNDYGSASGEFILPTGRLLGNWSLRTSLHFGQADFRVEEYKRPTFTTSLTPPEGALRLNQPATFKGQARYYFGLPVAAGSVRWRVTREPMYPGWWYWELPITSISQAQVVANGTATLDAEGTFQLTFTPEAEEPRREEDKALSYSYRIAADVTDEGGETRTAEHSFRIGWRSVEAQLDSEQQFLLAGEPGVFNLVRSDLNGTPRPGQGTWRVVALKQPAQALMPADQPAPLPEGELPEGQPRVVTEGDKLQPRWQADSVYSRPHMLQPRWQAGSRHERMLWQWEDGAQVARGEATHGEQGETRLELAPLKPGAYRLRYETVDDFGERYETFRDFVVVGERVPLAVPAVLQVQRSSVRVGDTANVLVHSGFAGQPLYLEVYRGGKRVSHRELRGGKSSALVRLPVREEDRGGFTVVLFMVRDHQLLRLSESVFVPWSDKELKLEFATFRDRVRPGAKETWQVKVSGKRSPRRGASLERLAVITVAGRELACRVAAPAQPPSSTQARCAPAA